MSREEATKKVLDALIVNRPPDLPEDNPWPGTFSIKQLRGMAFAHVLACEVLGLIKLEDDL